MLRRRGFVVDDVDILIDPVRMDLFDLSVQGLYLKRTREGFYIGVIIGFPCNPRSRARLRPGPARVLATVEFPWGLPGLSHSDQAILDDSHALFDFAISIVHAQSPHGWYLLENPEDLGDSCPIVAFAAY